MNEHRAQALAALEALEIRSSTSFAWYGAARSPLTPAAAGAMDADLAREYLLYHLQQELYDSFYCRGGPVATPRRPPHVKPMGATAFAELLAASNRGQGTLQPGWLIRGEGEGQLVIERGGLSLWVAPEQTVAGTQPGTVALLLPSELRKASPGFYVALGQRTLDEAPEERIVRIYWHLTSAAAPRLIDRLTSSLNAAAIPFQLKVIDDPDRYDRCDAGVLYAPRGAFAALAPHVRETHTALAGELREGVPAFTKRLGRGLGLAEDPGDGQSFGMHRALLLAQAAVRAHERGQEDAETRVGVLGEVFREHGLDLDTPYLGHGSEDQYEIAPA
ncbi:MAG TPA: T3SS effector HopA1 family protein [Solirubrobacteraceae bacterium]|nr:T3SS effector HopA1 family protein [Solirubrobacteraceae bacterium]